jgi:hypothetical protein
MLNLMLPAIIRDIAIIIVVCVIIFYISYRYWRDR